VGTAASFFIMAFAPSAIFLLLARMLDGLTAGNIPVAFAVISDSTKLEDRAGAFGYISSAFNFGFVFGPAIAALTVNLNPTIPFIIAGVITIIAALLTMFYLPETNTHMGEVKEGKLFDFKHMWHALFNSELNTLFNVESESSKLWYLANRPPK
jgi:MFS family permease